MFLMEDKQINKTNGRKNKDKRKGKKVILESVRKSEIKQKNIRLEIR